MTGPIIVYIISVLLVGLILYDLFKQMNNKK